MKTSELTGAQLDWSVAKCEGRNPSCYRGVVRATSHPDFPDSPPMFGPELHYSTDWSQAGPIIERMEIALCVCGTRWEASCVIDIAGGDTDTIIEYGPTPLIAAMRAYVASKLGEYVDVPF